MLVLPLASDARFRASETSLRDGLSSRSGGGGGGGGGGGALGLEIIPPIVNTPMLWLVDSRHDRDILAHLLRH